MLVLLKATQIRQVQITEIQCRQECSQTEAEELAESHFDLVKNMAHRFMTLVMYGGSPTPMDWLLRLKAYGMKIRMTIKAESTVDWVEDRLLYGKIQFSMPQLRGMIHGLVQTTRTELYRDLLLLQVTGDGHIVADTTSASRVDWDHLVDNPAEVQIGWNFIKDPRNPFDGMDGSAWLMDRLSRDENLYNDFIDWDASDPSKPDGQGLMWRQDRIRRYDQTIQQFREHLLVLVHMTGGLPARGTELITVQYANGVNGGGRGIFIEDGLVACVTAYHKNIGASGKSKTIHRYLPREVGEMVVSYIWLVIPFRDQLQRVIGSVPANDMSSFLWEPREEEGWAMPDIRKRPPPSEGEEEAGAGGRELRERRDWSRGNKRRRTARPRVESPLQSIDDDDDAESIHSPDLNAMPYVADKWDSGKIGRVINKASLQWMEVSGRQIDMILSL